MSFIKYLKENLESNNENIPNKIIRTSYETWDEESLEAGDTDDRGWEDEEGQSMIPDEYDKEEGITAIDNAVKFLRNKGVIEPSSSHFHPGIWYISQDDVDIRSGDRTQYSFHLDGFTPEEEKEIFNKIRNRR